MRRWVIKNTNLDLYAISNTAFDLGKLEDAFLWKTKASAIDCLHDEEEKVVKVEFNIQEVK